jgi:hypothetical protein
MTFPINGIEIGGRIGSLQSTLGSVEVYIEF